MLQAADYSADHELPERGQGVGTDDADKVMAS
jgi:hypothetical protein